MSEISPAAPVKRLEGEVTDAPPRLACHVHNGLQASQVSVQSPADHAVVCAGNGAGNPRLRSLAFQTEASSCSSAEKMHMFSECGRLPLQVSLTLGEERKHTRK